MQLFFVAEFFFLLESLKRSLSRKSNDESVRHFALGPTVFSSRATSIHLKITTRTHRQTLSFVMARATKK